MGGFLRDDSIESQGMLTAVAISSFALFLVGLVALRSRHHKRHSLREPLINSPGVVEQSLTPQGAVLVHGELWLARSLDGAHIPANTKVIVVGTDRHLIVVS